MLEKVETGRKPELVSFVKQIEKRFAQGYSKVLVVVTNQKQKKRYEDALLGLGNVSVVKFTELWKTDPSG